MNDIVTPPRLLDLLNNHPLFGPITSAINNLTPFLSSELYFFPEYTDHGPAHIASTLAAADYLIPDSSLALLTPDDIATLILATLLHDSAMHLPPDCFLALIDPASDWNNAEKHPLLSPLDTKPWPALFDDFFADARRWDGRTLHNILGDATKPPHEEEDLYQYIKRPAEMNDPDHWPPKYRKFLAEFLRKHHGRLAHEFALHGLPPLSSSVSVGRTLLSDTHCGTPRCVSPSPNTPPLSLPNNLPPHLLDLAGLIARSHTLPLRDTFDYLQEHYSARVTCYNTHPIYLMSLLRIADYLDMTRDRVSASPHPVQHLRSAVSIDEWNKHRAAHEIRDDEHDKEAIFVFCKPESARTFLQLRKFLVTLQSELDTTFAVLGEVYSLQPKLSPLALSLRRVKSNLDNPADYVRNHNPPYYPIEARFDTAGPDLLKLLIKPLYGDRPEIGVRELLQNALDAVHELRHYCKTHNIDINTLPFPDQKADVLISIDKDEKGDHWLTVSDKGIGMTPEVIRDYFLKAGASYRESDAWRKQFTDEAGKSKVLRSGRFGVGIMAAFLLGPEIRVTTRHVEAIPENGVLFRASFESNTIELHREPRRQAGTAVAVRLSQQAWDSAVSGSSDWYVLDDPKVERRSRAVTVEQRRHFPLPGSASLPLDWRLVSAPGYDEAHWTYNDDGLPPFYDGVAPFLACNGILVRDLRHRLGIPHHDAHAWDWPDDWSGHVPFSFPTVSVFDPDQNLPLNLQRDRLQDPSCPFAHQLMQDITKDFCAFLLVHAPRSRAELRQFRGWPLPGEGRWPPLGWSTYLCDQVIPFFTNSEGTALIHPWHLIQADIRKTVWFPVDSDSIDPVLLKRSVDAAFWLTSGLSMHSGPEQDKEMPSYQLGDCIGQVVDGYPLTGSRWEKHAYTGALSGGPEFVNTDPSQPSKAAAAIAQIAPDRIACRDTPFTRVWQGIMRHPIIPYDPDERKKKFAHAFEALAEYIEVWQTPNLPGWRGELVRRLRGQDK